MFTRTLLVIVLGFFVVGGCGIRPIWYGVEVRNRSGADVHHVEIKYDNGSFQFSFGNVAYDEKAEWGNCYGNVAVVIPEYATISWVDKDEQEHSCTLNLREQFGERIDYYGQQDNIILVIEKDSTVNARLVSGVE